MRFHSFHPPSKFVAATLAALATLSLAAVASAQVQYPVYSEDFQTGYAVNNQTLSDQNVNGIWGTNDEDTGGQYTYNGVQTGTIGQSDFVGAAGNFTPVAGGYAGALGGVYGQAVAPGLGAGTVATPTAVTLSHALPTIAAVNTVTFSTDFQVTQPSLSLAAHDTFGFALLTGGMVTNPISGATTVTPSLTVTFQPNGANQTNSDNIYVNGALTAFAINLGTNTRYKLTVSVTVGGAFNVYYQGENLLTGALTGTQQLIATGAYVGGTITGYAATFALQNNASVATASNLAGAGANNVAHTGAGSNVLYFDNVLVTVPEPSTYAMLGLGALGLAALVRRSRRAQAI